MVSRKTKLKFQNPTIRFGYGIIVFAAICEAILDCIMSMTWFETALLAGAAFLLALGGALVNQGRQEVIEDLKRAPNGRFRKIT